MRKLIVREWATMTISCGDMRKLAALLPRGRRRQQRCVENGQR